MSSASTLATGLYDGFDSSDVHTLSPPLPSKILFVFDYPRQGLTS